MSKGFDMRAQQELAKQQDNGVDVHIHGIDGQPLYYEENGQELPVVINVSGEHSSQYRRAEAAARKRRLKPSQLTGQYIYDENIEKMTAVTNGWKGFFVGETILQCTPHNVRELYKNCPWVLEQVMEAVHDYSRFFEN